MLAFIKNTTLLLSNNFLRLLAGLFVGVWLARYLGTEQYGYLSFFISLYAIAKVFNSLGIEQICVKNISTNELLENDYRNAYYIIKFISGLLINILFLSYIYLGEHQSALFVIPLFALFIFQGVDFYELTSQIKANSKVVVNTQYLSLAISSIVKVICIIENASLNVFLFLLFLDYVLMITVYFYKDYKYIYSLFKDLNNKKHYILIKNILKNSLPLFLSAAAVILYLKIDILMIYEMKSPSDAGLYAAAARLSEVIYFLPSILLTGMFPLLVKKHQTDSIGFTYMASSLILLFLTLSLIFSLVTYLFSKEIVNLLYGEDYAVSASILAIHAFATIPVFIGVIFRKLAIIENAQSITLYSTLTGLCLNVLLNYFFIPKYGTIGAAYTTLISRSFGSIIIYLCFTRTRYFWQLLLTALSFNTIKKILANYTSYVKKN